ncbi:MAG: PadR family transcriptional regulator [Pseudonocardiaceae bacterium]
MDDDHSTSTGFPRDYLRACLALLLAESPSHGYELVDQLAGLGPKPEPGGIYRILRTMEAEQLVRSSWEPSANGPQRRRYTLTHRGQRWLNQRVGAWRRSEPFMTCYLERHQRMTLRGDMTVTASARCDVTRGSRQTEPALESA